MADRLGGAARWSGANSHPTLLISSLCIIIVEHPCHHDSQLLVNAVCSRCPLGELQSSDYSLPLRFIYEITYNLNTHTHTRVRHNQHMRDDHVWGLILAEQCFAEYSLQFYEQILFRFRFNFRFWFRLILSWKKIRQRFRAKSSKINLILCKSLLLFHSYVIFIHFNTLRYSKQ